MNVDCAVCGREVFDAAGARCPHCGTPVESSEHALRRTQREALKMTVETHLEHISHWWSEWNRAGYPLGDAVRAARALLAELEAADKRGSP